MKMGQYDTISLEFKNDIIKYRTPFLFSVDKDEKQYEQMKKVLKQAGRFHNYQVIPYNTGNDQEDYRLNKQMLVRIGKKYGWKTL